MAKDKVQILSPAKVNLTLEIGSRRPDGYHEIDSIVQTIDLADTLFVESAPDGVLELTIHGADIPSDNENFVLKAAREFFEAARIKGGARFRLTKRIPVKAGLGGGSSNTAAALIALNALYATNITRDVLSSLALRVSSDAGLFMYGGTLRMKGRGDVIHQLPDAPRMHLVIVKPECAVSTRWAYELLDQVGPRTQLGRTDQAEAAVRVGDKLKLIESFANDFDSIITSRFPEVAEAKRLLAETGAVQSMLCGSGSAAFGVYENEQLANNAARMLRSSFAEVFSCRTLSRAECMEMMTPR